MRRCTVLAASMSSLLVATATPAAEPRGVDTPQRDPNPPGADADGENEEKETPHTGFIFGAAPGVAFDVSDRKAGFNIMLEGGYGAPFGPIVLAPGAAAVLFVPKGKTVLMGFPELKVLVPLGRFAPYGAFGVGVGTNTENGDAGLAVRGGGGVRYALSDFVALGLEVAYHDVVGFKVMTASVGPVGSF